MRNDIDYRVEELLNKMTLEEKVGQLHHSGVSIVGAFEVSFEELINMLTDGRITPKEFEEYMSNAEEDFHEESRVRHVKELKSFKKVFIKSGEEKDLHFVIKNDDLGYYNEEMKYITEKGTFKVFAGGNSEDLLDIEVVL